MRIAIRTIEVTVADSWVITANKQGVGNGEAKLYVGYRTDAAYREFFGSEPFKIQCVIRKSNLVRHLNELRHEYAHPTFAYRKKDIFPTLWRQRLAKIESLSNEYNYFSAEEQSHLGTNRGYLNSDSSLYTLLRELALPNFSSLSITKYVVDNQIEFEFRLLPTYVSLSQNNWEYEALVEEQEDDSEEDDAVNTTIQRVIRARVRQEHFRRLVLEDCQNTCAFTGINEPRLLIAGHLKPWSVATNAERLNPQNGLALSPTFDKLINDGFVSLDEDRRLLLSPLLSPDTCLKLGLVENEEIDAPLLGPGNSQRQFFMDYHRKFVFQA